MGCWDIYCFICGNTCHNLLGDINEYIEEIKSIDISKTRKQNEFTKYIKKIQSSPTIISDLKELNKNTKWLNKCTMLLSDNNIVHNVEETGCNILFEKENFSAEHIGRGNLCGLFQYGTPCGIFIHTDCWKFVKNKYNIELNISYLPPVSEITNYKNFNIDYGEIEKYWDQDFKFSELAVDKKQYLCSSPLKNDKNITQIKKNINNLKLKNKDRVGPVVSATFYKNGDIKIGKNKNFWIIKNNKWTEIKEKIIKQKVHIDISKVNNKQRKIIENIPLVGLYSKQPLFMSTTKGIKKNVVEVEFLLTESYKETFLSLFTNKK